MVNRSTAVLLAICVVLACACSVWAADQPTYAKGTYYSWDKVKNHPWEKLPALTNTDLKDITGYSELIIQDDHDSFSLQPGTKNAFGPVHEYHPTEKGNWAVYGPDYRAYTPYPADKPEQDVGVNCYMNLRSGLANLPFGEMFCFLRYGTSEKTSGFSFPRDLVFVRKAYMDHLNDGIQPGPRYIANIFKQPKLTDSIVGYYKGMAGNYVVIDTCLGTAPRFENAESDLWVRRYQQDVQPKHLAKDRKWVKEENANDPTIGDYTVREFSDGKFYLKKVTIGKKDFQYVENDLDTLKKNLPTVEKLGQLKASDLQTAGWEPYLSITHDCKKLNELIKDDVTLDQVIARWQEFLYSCKYYWADSWGWNPLDYMLDTERYDCDSAGKMVMSSLRLKGFPASVAFQPGHGWCECYLAGTGFAMGIDMTAGNSKIFRQTNEMLGYQFDKGVLDTPQVVEDCAMDDAHSETGDGPSEYGKVFMSMNPDWYVIGPFDYPDEHSYDLSYPPEKEQIIGKTYTGKNGAQCVWTRPFRSEKAGCVRLDMVDQFAKEEWYIFYALGFYYSPVERNCQMRIGTDDTSKVWINDKLVQTCKVHRGIVVDNDIVPVTLKEGWNKVVVKIGQGTGGVGFLVRFTDDKGVTLPDLQYTCEPWGIDPSYPNIAIKEPDGGKALDGKQKVVAQVAKGDVTKVEARFSTGDDKGSLPWNEMKKNDDGTYSVEIDPVGVPERAEVEVCAYSRDGRMTITREPVHVKTSGLAPDTQGLIHDWLLFGPYPNPKDGSGFDKEYVDPATVDFTEAGGWKSIPPNKYSNLVSYRSPYLNFTTCFDQTEWVFAYAGTYVYSAAAQNVKLAIGSDDGMKAWMNGKLVAAHDIGRGAALDQDLTSVALNAGWNKLLIKVTQGVGGWGLYARFLDDKGNPVHNLKVSATKPQ